MTEDEAKTKACFRAATFGASQQLADGPGPRCIGSACMAWRWMDAAKGYDSAAIRNEQGGYCGLAGGPQ